MNLKEIIETDLPTLKFDNSFKLTRAEILSSPLPGLTTIDKLKFYLNPKTLKNKFYLMKERFFPTDNSNTIPALQYRVGSIAYR